MTDLHQIRKGDKVCFRLKQYAIWGRAGKDLLPGETQVEIESLDEPGLSGHIKVTDIIAISRVEAGKGTITQRWE